MSLWFRVRLALLLLILFSISGFAQTPVVIGSPSPSDCSITAVTVAGPSVVATGDSITLTAATGVAASCFPGAKTTWAADVASAGTCSLSAVPNEVDSIQVSGLAPGKCKITATVLGVSSQPYTVTIPDDDPFAVDVIGKGMFSIDSLSTVVPSNTGATNSTASFGADIDLWTPLARNAWYGEVVLSLSQAPGTTLNLTNVDTFSRDFEFSALVAKRITEFNDLHTFVFAEGGFYNSFNGQVLQNFLTWYDAGLLFKKNTGPNEAVGQFGYGRNPINNDIFEWGQIFIKGHVHVLSSGNGVLGMRVSMNVKTPPSVPDGITRRATGYVWVGVNFPGL